MRNKTIKKEKEQIYKNVTDYLFVDSKGIIYWSLKVKNKFERMTISQKTQDILEKNLPVNKRVDIVNNELTTSEKPMSLKSYIAWKRDPVWILGLCFNTRKGTRKNLEIYMSKKPRMVGGHFPKYVAEDKRTYFSTNIWIKGKLNKRDMIENEFLFCSPSIINENGVKVPALLYYACEDTTPKFRNIGGGGRKDFHKNVWLEIAYSKSSHILYSYASISSKEYLIDKQKCGRELLSNRDIYFPLEVDTEYTTEGLGGLKTDKKVGMHVTTQMKNPICDVGHIFITPEYEKFLIDTEQQGERRHSVAKSDFHPIDFLRWEGEEAELVVCEEVKLDEDGEEIRYPTTKLHYKKHTDIHIEDAQGNDLPIENRRPKFTFVLYCYFGLADIPKIFRGEPLKCFLKAVSKGHIGFTRRLTTQTQLPKNTLVGWNTPFILKLNNLQYRIVIEVVDVGALMGNASYKVVCQNLNINLTTSHLWNNRIEQLEKNLSLYKTRKKNLQNSLLEQEHYNLDGRDIEDFLHGKKARLERHTKQQEEILKAHDELFPEDRMNFSKRKASVAKVKNSEKKELSKTDLHIKNCERELTLLRDNEEQLKGKEKNLKEWMEKHITQMDRVYIENPSLFDLYCFGDLKHHEILKKNSENVKSVWKQLNILDEDEENYVHPSLTIGTTVNQLFKSKVDKIITPNKKFLEESGPLYPLFINHHLEKFSETYNAERKEKVTDQSKLYKHFLKEAKIHFLEKASAKHLKGELKLNAKEISHIFRQSKCDGGRCRNAKPTVINKKGCLVDIDVGGAYASMMSAMTFPIGEPVFITFKDVLLSDFLKPLSTNKKVLNGNKELLSRLYCIRISAKQLSYNQTLISSWFGVKREQEKKINEEFKNKDYTEYVNLNSGENKIFFREIESGVLTSDVLDIINNVWSPKQREDFFSKTKILSIGFYPKSLQLESKEELYLKYFNHIKGRDFKIECERANIMNEDVCHAWFCFSLGSEFIDVMKFERSKHPKKTPLNELYKLMGNTMYGDMISRHFVVSNMIVGNNITAGVRCMLYLSELGLNLMGSITDGQVFDLNQVVERVKSKYLQPHKFSQAYKKTKAVNVKEFVCDYGQLLKDEACFKDTSFVVGKQSFPLKIIIKTNDGEKKIWNPDLTKMVDNVGLRHLQKVFPNVALLNAQIKKLTDNADKIEYKHSKGLFGFEMKDFVEWSVHHGSANYWIKKVGEKEPTLKMRSYEKKKQEILIDGEVLKVLKKRHVAFYLDQNNNLELDWKYYQTVSPAEMIMEAFKTRPTEVPLLPDYYLEAMLKINEYRNNYKNKWTALKHLNVGDSIVKIKRIRYFSLTTHTYKTIEQYKAWKKFHERRVEKYGLGIELYFLNEDGKSINYKKMVEDVDEMIVNGMEPQMLDKHYNFSKRLLEETRKKQIAYNRAKVKMEEALKYVEEEYDDEDLEGW
jgi:hypothetical protein